MQGGVRGGKLNASPDNIRHRSYHAFIFSIIQLVFLLRLGFLTTAILLRACEQFKHYTFTSKGLWGLCLFVNVIKGREHNGLFKITIIAATILIINVTIKAFSIDIIIMINNQQVKKISLSFFRKKCGKYDCPNLQKLLVSIFSIK